MSWWKMITLPYLCPDFFVGIFRASKWNTLQFPQIWVTAMARKSFNKKCSHPNWWDFWVIYVYTIFCMYIKTDVFFQYHRKNLPGSFTIKKYPNENLNSNELWEMLFWSLDAPRILGPSETEGFDCVFFRVLFGSPVTTSELRCHDS